MARLATIQGYGKELRTRLVLKSYPLAVKMLEKEEDIPENAVRPVRDFGHHLSQCQAFSLSRRNKMTIAMLKEDHWCPEPVIGFGFAEPPEFFLEGHNRYPGQNVKSLEAGKVWAQSFPRLDYGKYIGIVSAPLFSSSFSPDVVVIYCNPAQLTLLLNCAFWNTGLDPYYRMSPCAVCVYAIVLPLQNKEYQVSSPCGGDRTRGMAQDDELIFSVPAEKLREFIGGVRSIDETYASLPFQSTMMPEYQLADSYRKLAEMLGQKI